MIQRLAFLPTFVGSRYIPKRRLLACQPAESSTRIQFTKRLSALSLAVLCAALPPAPLATALSFSTMPSRPYVYRLPQATRPLDLAELNAELSATEEQRQEAYNASRKIQAALVNAKSCLEQPSNETMELTASRELHDLVVSTVGEMATRQPRDGNLGYRVEDVVRYQALIHFLQTGALLPPSAAPFATDEEYLAGACMGLSQDLSRYGMGRATARDATSVTQAKDLVQEILAYLLQFDFRNGPLRRKYDGTKYALKSLETLLYELAVTGSSAGNGDVDMNEAGGEKPAKHHKPNDDDKPSFSLLAENELTSLRERMEHRDNLRENLIKRCRDGQKAAKQSIFALHRGDVKRASTLLETCASCIENDLLPIVQEEPSLRYGSFANLMEEYVEAKLFFAWLYGADKENQSNASDKNGQSPAVLLRRDEFVPFTLEPSEYLGGLCDLTGEVGRYAVQRATSRDGLGVKLALQTNKQVLTALETSVDRLPKDIGKKFSALRQSVEKLERILYEMSLSEAAGGRNVQTNSMDMEPEFKDRDGNDE